MESRSGLRGKATKLLGTTVSSNSAIMASSAMKQGPELFVLVLGQIARLDLRRKCGERAGERSICRNSAPGGHDRLRACGAGRQVRVDGVESQKLATSKR